MKTFPEYQSLDLISVSENVQQFWEQNQTFQKSMNARKGKEEFVFYEGPPSANGLPGIHHVMGRSLKDIFCRFQTQMGKQVIRKAGWDTHGLPIELGVEKALGITKEDIGSKLTVEEYNAECKKAVMKYTDVWNDLTTKIGYWVDLEKPYVTYEPKYMETVWWLLKTIYDKGLIYKGYTIQPYSPKAGTGLSSHELNQPGTYKEVSDTTVTAQFKVKKESNPLFQEIDGDISILAWTTTPWTLPSNTALIVGEKIDYVLVKTYNQYTFEPIQVILAKALLEKQFGKKYLAADETALQQYTPEQKTIPYTVITHFTGKQLVGTSYEQLLPWFLPAHQSEKAFRVIAGDFVTTDDGTGIVHAAPTFGADDDRVAKENNVPPMLILDKNSQLVPLVDLQGKFVKGAPETFSGKYIKNEYYNDGEAPEKSFDVELAILLKTENKAFKVEKYVHSYPHCWRTDKPVLYYPLDSWFIKMTQVRNRLVELNKEINWKPKSTGEGRFGNWLENVNDWNLSRSRYWGIPIPIWRTEDNQEEIIIGSLEQLMLEIEKAIAAGVMHKNPFNGFEVGNMDNENYQKIDLHKNIVDQITLVSASGKPMKRESDLIDVWFDSGSMPYAQLHYPFENKELVDEKKSFPADFIAEGVDQTRGWFYTLHAIATAAFDSVAYKNVMSNGLVLDKNGQKMSKRLGNGIDPFHTLSQFGPDATRWYMISNAMPWENLKFDIEGIDEVRRKFFGTLYNTYSFFALYANVDGFTYKETDVENRPEIDQWILSELQQLVLSVTEYYQDYEPTKVARSINSFVNDHLSNWYVRLCRRRFWKGDYSQDKISAYQTLYQCLITISKIAAPIAPFFMDQLYQDLNNISKKEKYESVHLSDFPIADEHQISQTLIRQTALAQQITSMVFSLRKKENIKVRQPLQKLLVPVLDDQLEKDLLAVSELIKQEVNVKEIQWIHQQEASNLISKMVKPNFKLLGPKLGKDMKLVSDQIINWDAETISFLEEKGQVTVENYPIHLDEVEIFTKDIPGWTIANEGKLTVALDLHITKELRAEGIAREIVNRVQNIRKDIGLELNDKIGIEIEQHNPFVEEILSNMDYINSEVLSQYIRATEKLENATEVEIDEHTFYIKVLKIN